MILPVDLRLVSCHCHNQWVNNYKIFQIRTINRKKYIYKGYALLANLPPVQGLYMAFFPLLMYLLFGTSSELSIGAIAIVSMLSGDVISAMSDNFHSSSIQNSTNLSDLPDANLVKNYKITIGCSLALLTGLIQFVMGFCGLGLLTSYFSNSFISGYTCGSAVHVFLSQLSRLFGLKNIKRYQGFFKVPRTFVNIILNISKTNVPTLILSIICILYLTIFKGFLSSRIKKLLKFEFPSELLLVSLVCLYESNVLQLQPVNKNKQ
jgi:solute carrier family 26 protein